MVYPLTVTAASPGDLQQAQVIKNSRQIWWRGSSSSLPISGRDPGDIQTPVSFDVNTGILIEPDLAEAYTGTGPFGIKMTLQTTVGPDSGEPPARPFAIRGVVLAGRSHTYSARHGRATATVNALNGKRVDQLAGQEHRRRRRQQIRQWTRCHRARLHTLPLPE